MPNKLILKTESANINWAIQSKQKKLKLKTFQLMRKTTRIWLFILLDMFTGSQ